ncbi:MAG: TolC family protein, partial [Aliifodinibius sp.]|nr:TolC family protein [candidate division Zixibacteria bacterium]NIT57051.1 TolC family protein [Fodinibius sp.]NIW46522.1 TolC family protein [Gammaproteobacteria bacterium]NIS47124.1 TolC family protein [candidate division Zixibacteria bacterium]NIU15261.1 TolC family protein [candidate division Zixibacteria bacterium]
NVKTTYYSLFFVDKSLETIDKNTRALEEFVKIAETKYSVGKGLQQDVLRAQVELSKMEDKRINLEQKRESLESRLNALLNRPVDQELGNIDTLRFIPLPYDYAQLTELTEQRRPLLQAWEAMIRQSDKKVNLAKKEYLPDFSVGLAYSQRDALQNGGRGVDFFSGMFSVKVPLYFWRKQRKQVEENRYQRISVQEKYNQIRNQIYSDLEDTFTDVQKNKRLVELFQTGIIPQAMQSLNSAIAGYQTDKVDFLTLLNNQINLFNFQLDYYRILTDYNKNIAQLEAIVGEQLIER